MKLPKLNTTIANVYQTQQRLTGLFVSAGSMLAILLELLLVIAGFTIAVGATSNIATMALFAVIGSLMAALVTKMTLTNAAKLRASLDAENEKRLAYKERSKGKTLPEDVKAELDKDIAEISAGRGWIYVLIGFGALISIICEKFAIDLLFNGMNWWIANGLSIFLSGLVSCTVVSGELHKKRDADIIKDSLSHDSFLELAAKANTYDAFNKKMLDAASTHVNEILDNTVLATYARTLVFTSIEETTGTENFAQQVETVRQQQLQIARLNEDRKQRLLAEVRGEKEVNTEPVVPIKLHDESEFNATVEPIQLHGESGFKNSNFHPREEPREPFQGEKFEGENGDRYASDYASQVEELYRENPAITPTQIAKSLGCSYGTAKKWLERVRPVKPDNAG